MALIKCYECEKEISDKAPACPQCGAPARPQITCPDCGQDFAASLTACSGCGCPVATREEATKDNVDRGVRVFHTSPVLFWFLGVTFLGYVFFLLAPPLAFWLMLDPSRILYRPWTLLSHAVLPVDFRSWFIYSSSMVLLTLLGSYRLSLSRQMTALVIGTLVGALMFTFLAPTPALTGPGFAVSGFVGYSLVFGIKYWHRLRWYSRAVTIWIGFWTLLSHALVATDGVLQLNLIHLVAFWVTAIISAVWLVPRPVKGFADEN